MKEIIEWEINRMKKKNHVSLEFLSQAGIQEVLNFHKSFPDYQVTPLRDLSNLANFLNISKVYVKDESYRFNLNAFKALGGSFAIGKYLAGYLDVRVEDFTFEKIKKQLEEKDQKLVFTTATDGNHGRGVAWAAQQFGQKAVVYMPKGSAEIRSANIKATGADCHITELNYDDTVRLAAEKAQEAGWIIIQDTAWEGYEEIPKWIMQGYVTMAAEALEQLKQMGCMKPTHIFLQAGVGSLAAAVCGYVVSAFYDHPPKIVVVEPTKANCMFQSARAGDGQPRNVSGDLDTLMAGLACGEPSSIAWEILREHTDVFISCPDYIAANGMRILGNPLGVDGRIVSGESGAVTTGILTKILKSDELKELRECLELDELAQVLVFSTEGDTDPEGYRRIVWDGEYPNVLNKGGEQDV